MTIRLIALDLDGTALDRNNGVRPATRRAIGLAQARGVEVMLVTGRHHVVTRPYHQDLGLVGPSICCNGTYVYDFAADRVVAGEPMSKDAAHRMLERNRRHEVFTLIYVDDAMTYEVVNPHLVGLLAWANARPEGQRPAIRQVARFEATIDATPAVWKFVVSHPDPAVLTRWLDEAGQDPAFSIEYSWHDRVDVMPAGNSKGARLISFAASRGIAPAEIAAFGDNHNDLSMISSVGHGVAMGNAEDAVKAVAAEVIGDNDGDALGEAIERLIG